MIEKMFLNVQFLDQYFGFMNFFPIFDQSSNCITLQKIPDYSILTLVFSGLVDARYDLVQSPNHLLQMVKR